ncbi:hypothetical protein CTA2_1177 [Colletotrichum tanaceti]|uniref:Uncharacterized protein n=1 Tax=Colletotrichum tanaceti TaxID=1306861 RepID=A0A4U6XQ27_9PEZI|nr:hypothetical protein CTA2_1177 [Colletotrichum tanaceti]TKW57882.1 hypothetical protein CTA1_8328 [Colletotrichum tanaceti]
MPSSNFQKGQLQAILESKGIRFYVKTGGAKHDERIKAVRTNSSDSQSSSSSSSTANSTH